MKKMAIWAAGLLLCCHTVYAADWFKATAKPSLVVRDAPDVDGSKLGTVPYNGRVKVLERVSSQESIGGREGHWVKIQWKNTTAYAFDAFLEAMDTEPAVNNKVVANSQENEAEWFRSNAKPSLVVRSQPNVDGKQIGSVPYDGKIKVLKVVSSRESIGGRTGRWVKVSWQNTTGYVFDAFLEPMDNVRTGVNSVSASSQLDREIAMQLGLFTLAAKNEGYVISHDLEQGQLASGKDKRYSLQLEQGKDYRILTACDNNCTDLDTQLRDENGNEIDTDFSDDDLPTLTVTPKWTGTFNLQVTMRSCSREPCHYGVAVFGR